MPGSRYELGTVEAAEAVIKDLYVDLRVALVRWSEVTQQTPQPRMGYIGQHLTSVVTGYPGGRSGARGKDLLLGGGKHAEIKTCTRVDQLGKCLNCGQAVSSIEARCPACDSDNIQRNDDSKWLIGIRNEEELAQLFSPESYYLVLFDFADLRNPTEINARIYQVDPRCRGFAYCLVDYYFNIRARSRSAAPFNLWPFLLKFHIMQPKLIYYSLIGADNSITTTIFPGQRGEPQIVVPEALTSYARSTGFTPLVVEHVARAFGVTLPTGVNKLEALQLLENSRQRANWDDRQLADEIAEAMYGERIKDHRRWLPAELQD
jgi:hypothetical protein